MNIYIDHVEKEFTGLLQKNIQFTHHNKVLKEGKLMLFCVKDFYLNFQLLPANGQKMIHFEIPFPFKCEAAPGRINLSYLQKHFTKGDADIEHHILFYFIKSPSKFYNSEVLIKQI